MPYMSTQNNDFNLYISDTITLHQFKIHQGVKLTLNVLLKAKYCIFLLEEFQLTLSNMHLHLQGTILAHIVFIKDLSISLITSVY